MTSSVFHVPDTRQEITVITADQHVHFLAIDGPAKRRKLHMCTPTDDVKEKEKNGLSDGRLSDPVRLSLWSYFDHNAITAIRKIPDVKAHGTS